MSEPGLVDVMDDKLGKRVCILQLQNLKDFFFFSLKIIVCECCFSRKVP